MKFDKILDNAIQDVRNGAEISAVVSNYPAEIQNELQAMLGIITIASSLKTKAVPTPTKRRLYLEHAPQTQRGFVAFFESLRVAPTALAALVLLLTGTAYAAQSSLPGDKLFAVKKSYESLQVKLASNPEQRANLQLQIAAQRFQDAQKVLAQGDDSSKKQAIDEMNQQTAVALNDIKSAAVSISNSNPNIVKQAEDLTKNQSSLIAKADPNIVDSNALQKNQESKIALKDIKTLIAAANEESGATIAPSDTINANGAISMIKDNVITVNRNAFTVNDDTIIAANDKTALKLSDLNVGDEVSIEGKILNLTNIAELVTVTKAAQKPQDKPKDTPKETPKEAPKEKPVIEPVVLPSPTPGNDTFGGYIPEPPVELPAANQ